MYRYGGIMRKIVTCMLVGIFLLSAGACGGGEDSDRKPAPEPMYSSEEKFDIGMWVGVSDKIVEYDEWGQKTGKEIQLTDEEFLEKYEWIAEAGFTIAYPGYEYMLWGTEAYNKKCLKAAHEVGIKQIISIPALNDYMIKAKTLVESGLETEEQAVEKVKGYLKPYLEYEYADAFYGCFIGDEPGADEFDQHAFSYKIFSQAAPDLCYYTNLFPVIAGGAQLGGVTPINYDTYIAQYLEKIKTPYLSYDHYPLKKGKDYFLESSFLQNMEIIRKALNEEGEGREMWTFLQSISFGSNRSLESVGDATFQAYSFLAYGGDAIQWFCFACPPPYDGASYFGNDALLDRNYQKTPAFDYVKTANGYIQSLMPWYKNFTWKGVMTSSENGGEGNFKLIERMESGKNLKKVEGTEDVLVGMFDDKDGREGCMVVNFTDPGRKLNNTVTLSFERVKDAIIILNGEKSVQSLKKGKLTLELKSGEGCFVIPY